MTANTLVLGGTGKTGRRVAERLTAKGVPVRIGSRSGNPPFDWDNPATWEPALENVTAAYVVYLPDLGLPGADEVISAFAKTAVARGVERFVLLSGRGEENAQRSERAAIAAGGTWTIVRASWFNQNFSESFLIDGVRSGLIALPAPGWTIEPFADVDDVADVAVAALTEPRHAGQVYEVTGRQLRTLEQTVAVIAGVTGRDIRYRQITPAEFAAVMLAQGVPGDEAEQFAEMFTQILDGRNSSLTDGVQRALGRPPRDFADYAREAVATGVWGG
jgi:uncharacterized protein YbjT (DUF2867 family)